MTRLFLYLLLLSFVACKSDPAATSNEVPAADTTQTESAAPNPAAAPSNGSKAEAKVMSLQNNKIKADNGTEIELPGAGKGTVIFFARHAETLSGKTGLSTEGQSRTGSLAMLMQNTGLQKVFFDGNSSLQTALMPARANGVEDLLLYKADDPEFFPKLLKEDQNKRMLIVGTPQTLTGFLTKLGKLEPVSETEYDNLYVAIIKDAGAAEIRHFKY